MRRFLSFFADYTLGTAIVFFHLTLAERQARRLLAAR